MNGELAIRNVVGWEAPLRFTRFYDATSDGWYVRTTFLREGQPRIIIGEEPLEEFPSELLIAQLMLIC